MSTYTPIASITLASAASSVTFSGIPQTYTDLVLVVAGSGTVAGVMTLQFNSDTGSNYSNTILFGDGSSAGSARASNATSINIGDFDQDSQSNNIVQLQNYSNSTTNKTVLGRGNRVLTSTVAKVGLWRNTTAITSVTVGITGGTTMNSGSTFNLYGIANASITNVAKATGGDSVVTDGTYWYHVFRSSGTFTPTQALTADCLVIAGGGGSGDGYGGGGGAGGLLAHTGQSLTAQAYTVTVGAGGGSNGSNSQFGSLTASIGGGRGGGTVTGSPQTGGSGGGQQGTSSSAGAAGTTGQGNAGGAGNPSADNTPGGGGGAGAAGATPNGGNGSSSYSSWGSATLTGQNVSGTYWYAGGGSGAYAGGIGGNGGGGVGGAGSNGTANTGGGGGGNGRSGGSGIVIIRYSAAA